MDLEGISPAAFGAAQHKLEDAEQRLGIDLWRTPGERCYLYVLNAGPFYKIGQTRDLCARIKRLSIQLPFKVTLIATFEVNNGSGWERVLHEVFTERRANGEWFELREEDVRTLYMIFAFVAAIEAT